MRGLVFLAFIGYALAAPKSSSRIVGGTSTTVEEYPFMSNMQYLWGDSIWLHSCGGILITVFSVLSAAHCYNGDAPETWRAVLGSSLATTGGTIYPATQLVLHPNFNDATMDYDVAIVKLASRVVISDSVRLASFAGPNYNLPVGEPVHAVGWGTVMFGGGASEQLLSAEVQVIDQTTCTNRYEELRAEPGFGSYPSVTNRMLCSGILNVGGSGHCHGDMGGPLVRGSVVVGITSWTYECGHPQYPGVSTRISVLTNWILANAL